MAQRSERATIITPETLLAGRRKLIAQKYGGSKRGTGATAYAIEQEALQRTRRTLLNGSTIRVLMENSHRAGCPFAMDKSPQGENPCRL